MLLSAFGRFNQRGGGAVCLLSADSTSEVGGGGGGGSAVRFQPIQPVGGAHVSKLLLQRAGGGGGGGGGVIQSRRGEGAHGYRVTEMRLVLVAKMRW